MKPGTGVQIVFAMFVCLGSMRIYASQKPFIGENIDVTSEAAQWQLFFMFSRLAIRVNLDSESLQDKDMFDLVLLSIQVSSSATMLLTRMRRVRKGNLTKKFIKASEATEQHGGNLRDIMSLGHSGKDLKAHSGATRTRE